MTTSILRGILIGGALVALAGWLPTRAAAWCVPSPNGSCLPAGICGGDCNLDGAVTIDDLLKQVEIAAAGLEVTECFAADSNSDQMITVDEILRSVSHALDGCTDLPPVTGDPLLSQQVDTILAPVVRDTHLPATAVLVSKGDQIVYMKAFGLADTEAREAATTQHVFVLASISKVFTALSVLKLVEDGLVGLDDPVGRYVPELERFGDAFTIRRLLNHTSGLPDYYVSPGREELLAIAPRPSIADVMTLLSDWGTLESSPGDTFAYANNNFEVLAALVERVRGRSFATVQQEEIYDAAGMRSTFSWPDPERFAAARFARPAGTFTAPDDPLGDLQGAGHVLSSVEDLYRFDRAVFTGRIVSLDLLAEALTPAQLNDGSEVSFAPFEPESSYGLGWTVGSNKGHRYVGHGGLTDGVRNYYVHFPDDDVTVVLLVARDFNSFRRVALLIADVYLPKAD